MNSNKILLIFILLLPSFQFRAQNLEDIEQKGIFKRDTTLTNNFVFDYFRQELDSAVFFSGVILMPADSISLYGINEYTIKVSCPKNGSIEIFFKSKLLYKYMLINNQINGTGICYYPFSSHVALQGTFRDGKLHGLVFVQKENGEIIEVMCFKNGKYLKHIYHWLVFSKKSLRLNSKNRSSNPLRGTETIKVY